MFSDTFRRVNEHLTEHELRTRKLQQRRIALIAAAALVVITIGYFSARPLLRTARGWQARRHAEKAFVFIDQEKWGDARDEASAAYQLQSAEPEAIRAVARLLSRAGQTDAIKFWTELSKKSPLTRTDLRDEATIALQAKDLEVCESAVEELVSNRDGGAKPADWLLAAQLAVQQQAFDRAIDYVNKIFASSSASDREQLHATLVLDAVSRVQGGMEKTIVLRRLAGLAGSSSQVSLDALVGLAQYVLMPNAPPENSAAMSTEEIIKALEAHPLAQAPHKLLAVDLRIHDHPEQREALLQNAITQWKGADNATLASLAAWLNTRGEYQRELDAIPQERAMQTRELFAQHVDALGALGRWDEIRRLIESERFPLDPVVEHMYLARCFAQQGQSNGAENNWRRAVEAAAGDVGKLMMLGDYAEKNGVYDIAAAAYDSAVGVSPKSRVAQQGRVRIAYAMHDTRKIRAILVDLAKIWPNDSSVQNDEAYSRLLLLPANANPAELQSIESIAQKLVEREPASLPHRTLLALARLKQNRANDALAVYKGLNVPTTVLTPGAVAVHAAVLAATGDEKGAKTEVARLPSGKLLPEEQALIQGLIP